MSRSAGWLEEATDGAPAELRRRVMEHAAAEAGREPRVSTVETLARSAFRALDAALGRPSDRSAALDLLSADALITLALLAQAEEDPRALEPLADRLLGSGAAGQLGSGAVSARLGSRPEPTADGR